MPATDALLLAGAFGCVTPRRRNGRAACIALVISLSLGGCANQVAQHEAPLFVDSGAPVAAGSAVADQSSSGDAGAGGTPAASSWAEQTYVYRGGRDPRTGLARTQL